MAIIFIEFAVSSFLFSNINSLIIIFIYIMLYFDNIFSKLALNVTAVYDDFAEPEPPTGGEAYTDLSCKVASV